jgi:hypothetical protein
MGSDADIIIRVGAAADSSLQHVLDSIPQSAARASKAARRAFEGGGIAGGAEAEARKAAKAQESAYRQNERIEARATAGMAREAQKRAREQERAMAYVAKVRTRYFEEQQRDEEKAAKKAQRDADAKAKRETRDAERRGQKGVGYISGAIGSVGHAALGLGTTIAGGAGIQFDVGSHIANTVELNKTATKIANSNAFVTGKSATAADVADITSTVKSAGNASNMSYGDVAGGLDALVAKTGDLKASKDMLGDLTQLAAASGSSMTDLSGAAGEVANALGDVPNKGQRVVEIMRAITKQGAEGAVEIKDLAQYGARLSSMAEFITGDRETSISQMSWMAQQAKSHGGATDAAEATSATKAFMGDLMSPKNAGRMASVGVDVFADKGHTKLKAPSEIMAQLFEKTGGDLEKIASIIPNKAGRKAAFGFAQTFNDAGGGKAGADAIRKSFEDHSKALTKEQVESANDLYKNSDAGKAQGVNNKLDEMGSQLFEKLGPVIEKSLPGLERLGEMAIKVAGEFGEFASAHPETAIVGAIVAKIGASALGDAISKAVTGAAGSKLGGGLAIAAATFTIGMATIQTLADARDKATTDETELDIQRRNVEHMKRMAPDSKETKDAEAALKTREGHINADRETMQNQSWYEKPLIGDTSPILAFKKAIGMDSGVSLADQNVVNDEDSIKREGGSLYEKARSHYDSGSGYFNNLRSTLGNSAIESNANGSGGGESKQTQDPTTHQLLGQLNAKLSGPLQVHVLNPSGPTAPGPGRTADPH